MTTTDPYSAQRRFHWRTIPVGILAAFGVIMLAFASFSWVYMSYTAWTGEPMYTLGPPPGFGWDNMTFTVVGGLCGATLLFASVQLWRGRWLLALLVVGVLVLICQLMSVLGVMRD